MLYGAPVWGGALKYTKYVRNDVRKGAKETTDQNHQRISHCVDGGSTGTGGQTTYRPLKEERSNYTPEPKRKYYDDHQRGGERENHK